MPFWRSIFNFEGSQGCKPLRILRRRTDPAYGGQRGLFHLEQLSGQGAELFRGDGVVEVQNFLGLPHPAIEEGGGAHMAY